MSFVVYDRKTTLCVKKANGSIYFGTEAAAAAAITRAKNGTGRNKYKGNWFDLRISESKKFHAKVERKETRHGIVGSSGKFEVGVNTPWTSGPWSETYWSS